MSEWAVLGFVALALYLVECLAWVEAAAVACFQPALLSRWRCGQGATFPGNAGGGLVILNLTNLGGSVVVCHLWPFSISPQGLTNLALDCGSGFGAEPRYIAFEDVKTVRAEFGDIQVNGKRLARVNSSVLATHLVQQIERTWRCQLDERASEIKAAVQKTLDERAAMACWTRFEAKTRTLTACCFALFIFAFVVSPTVLLAMGPYPSWMYLLAGLFGVTVATSIAYLRTHATLYPESSFDRWVHAASMVLLPVAAIRCVDKLSRDALSFYSAAVVSPMLCGVPYAVPLLRRQFIDLSNGSGDLGFDTSSTSAVECARWFRQLLATETKAALDRLNVPVSKAPVSDDETMVSYCPRCHEQFTTRSDASCPACLGVQLISFCAQETPAGTLL
jgi:hypothetical protein